MPALITIAPPITQVFGQAVPAKMRGAAMKSGQAAAIQLNLVDDIGNPVNLTDYGFPASGADPDFTIEARLQEAVDPSSTETAAGSVVDAATGQVTFDVPTIISDVPAVYRMEIGALNDGQLILSNSAYLVVERGLFSSTGGLPVTGNLPTVNEVRLLMRDAPESNLLTDQLEWDVAEIADAIVRCIMQWNSAQPVINLVYDSAMFPWRVNLLDGVCACLLETSAHWFRRNSLPYSAGGVSVNDLEKWKDYAAAAAAKREAWETWTRRIKAQYNQESCYAIFGSPYGGRGGW